MFKYPYSSSFICFFELSFVAWMNIALKPQDGSNYVPFALPKTILTLLVGTVNGW